MPWRIGSRGGFVHIMCVRESTTSCTVRRLLSQLTPIFRTSLPVHFVDDCNVRFRSNLNCFVEDALAHRLSERVCPYHARAPSCTVRKLLSQLAPIFRTSLPVHFVDDCN